MAGVPVALCSGVTDRYAVDALGEGRDVAVLVEIAELRRRAGQNRREDHVVARRGTRPSCARPRAPPRSPRRTRTPLTLSPRWYTAQVTASTSLGLGSRASAFQRRVARLRAVLAAEILAFIGRSATRSSSGSASSTMWPRLCAQLGGALHGLQRIRDAAWRRDDPCSISAILSLRGGRASASTNGRSGVGAA